MRFYVNTKYELVCAPDYHDKFGNVTADSLLINTGTYTKMLEVRMMCDISAILSEYMDGSK